ncbi:MAG: hypothetical protein ACLUEK_08455 [Oscillospiraceae bacterium]
MSENGSERRGHRIFDPDGSLTRAMVWTILARIQARTPGGGPGMPRPATGPWRPASRRHGRHGRSREQLVSMLWRSRGDRSWTSCSRPATRTASTLGYGPCAGPSAKASSRATRTASSPRRHRHAPRRGHQYASSRREVIANRGRSHGRQ